MSLISETVAPSLMVVFQSLTTRIASPFMQFSRAAVLCVLDLCGVAVSAATEAGVIRKCPRR